MRDPESHDELTGEESLYQRTWRSVHEQDDPQVLEDLVLHHPDTLTRVFAFCRLTGWSHWEACDAYSHLTYECGHVEGYSDERVLWLCDQLLEELGYAASYSGDPMPPEYVLREGAQMVPEYLIYGQIFLPSVSYVRVCARQEAISLGVAAEGIEFWLLGILRFAQLGDRDLHYAEFPFSPIADAIEDADRCRAELDRLHIDPCRLEPILRGVLVEGASSERALLGDYFAAARPRSTWVERPFKAADLLRVILRRPTDAIRLALMRLGLIMTLEAWIPQDLRAARKTPYRPFLFQCDWDIETVDLTLVDISRSEDLSGMFAGCSSLRSVDLSPLDTSHVTNMSEMFRGCEELRSLDLSTLDTSHVTDLSFAFIRCRSIKSLDLSVLDTSHVTSMGHMLQDCVALEQVSLSGIDTSRVVDIGFMFSGCTALRAMDLSGLALGQVRNMNGVFSYCAALERASLAHLDLSQVEDMTYLFMDCTSLTEVDLSGIDASRVVSMGYLFSGCRSLRSVDLRTLVAPNLLYVSKAFEGCVSLESFGIPSCWPLDEKSALPEPTADCGKWWSTVAGKWMSNDEIRQRGACADLFYNVDGSHLG